MRERMLVTSDPRWVARLARGAKSAALASCLAGLGFPGLVVASGAWVDWRVGNDPPQYTPAEYVTLFFALGLLVSAFVCLVRAGSLFASPNPLQPAGKRRANTALGYQATAYCVALLGLLTCVLLFASVVAFLVDQVIGPTKHEFSALSTDSILVTIGYVSGLLMVLCVPASLVFSSLQSRALLRMACEKRAGVRAATTSIALLVIWFVAFFLNEQSRYGLLVGVGAFAIATYAWSRLARIIDSAAKRASLHTTAAFRDSIAGTSGSSSSAADVPV